MNIPEDIFRLRQKLHKFPELSKREQKTANTIKKFIQPFEPDQVFENIGGKGVGFLFGKNPTNPMVLFRAELDALPIGEKTDVKWKSEVPGISHACGHDGHMTILAGLAWYLHQNPPASKQVFLLFQPAEETGTGAEAVIADPVFSQVKPDRVYAIHNIPGYPKASIVIKENHFAAASKGIIISLHGKTSHAAEPEKGLNPAKATGELLLFLSELTGKKIFNDFVLATIVHVELGKIAFGTSAGHAVIRATLRATGEDDMKSMVLEIEKKVKESCVSNGLEYQVSYTEEFPATMNDPASVQLVKDMAHELNLTVIEPREPFRWSEDFGHFSKTTPGALIGLGSGENQPALHNPDFDFPDDLIVPGIKLLAKLYQNHR